MKRYADVQSEPPPFLIGSWLIVQAKSIQYEKPVLEIMLLFAHFLW